MRRGTKYTFRISGGNTPNSNSEFHPLYFTTSASGGFAQMSPEERARQTILAGINVTQRDSIGNVVGYESPLQAPICQYQVSDATFLLSKSATFQEYYNTLDRSCAQNSVISNAAMIFEFTPTKDTPDLIYYQCVTHRNLGWKINVMDALSPPAPPPRAEPISAPLPAPVAIPSPPRAEPISAPLPAPVAIPSPVSVPIPLSASAPSPDTAPFSVPVQGTAPAPFSISSPIVSPVLNTTPASPTNRPTVVMGAPTADVPSMNEERSCGLFGLSFFCFGSQECGFFRRLLGLGGC
jgi:hypothetical protein